MLKPCHIESISQLKQLWEIDKEAYQDHSLEFEPFQKWWQRYPLGSLCVSLDERIVGSIGIYPISEQQAIAFREGSIKESDLLPVELNVCASEGINSWYCSGLVIVPEWQHKGILRQLIRSGIEAWRGSGHIKYSVSLYALAQTPPGRKALELFGMELAVQGEGLPDELDLYYFCSPDSSSLKQRFQRL